MPKRVPVQRIIVQRDGKQHVPEIGKPFEFTTDEIKDINEMNPDAVRKLIVESTAEDATGDDKTTKTTKPTTATKATSAAGAADL